MSTRLVAAIMMTESLVSETVHLDEQLVERLLALVMTTAKTGATLATDGIDLVDEDDGRCGLLCLREQIAHARCADADEHLDKVGAGDAEEGNARLSRDGARGAASCPCPEDRRAARHVESWHPWPGTWRDWTGSP